MAVEPRQASTAAEIQAIETQEWIDSLDWVLSHQGPERVRHLLEDLQISARKAGVRIPFTANTPYVNTIPAARAAALPGQPRDRAADQEHHPLERDGDGRPGQPRGGRASAGTSPPTPRPPRSTRSASTTSSAARASSYDGDQVYFQGHASPGIYARAFLEGRLDRGAAGELPPRAATPRRRPVVLSAPLADARLLGVPHRVDGPGADHGHLPGALQPLPGGPRAQAAARTTRSGPSWATARWTSRRRSARSRWPRASSSTT